MSWLSSVFSNLFRSTNTFTDEAVQAQLAAFRAVLNGGDNGTVRFWVEAGASYGHQSATANLVYRLARPVGDNFLNFAYAGSIEIYYEAADDLAKLEQLIPELTAEPPRINSASVHAIHWAAAPEAAVNFVFTGGASATVDYLTKLNARNCLVLQPYRWPVDEVLQRTGQTAINLATVPELGAGFTNRLFYIDPTLYMNPPWDDFAGNVKVQIVRDICENRLATFQLLTTYSIKSGISRLNANPTYAAALVCGSVMAWQLQKEVLYTSAKPVIILNFDDFGTPQASEEADLRAILNGGTAPTETGLRLSLTATRPDPNLVSNFKRRSLFFLNQGAPLRFHYLNYPGTLQAVTDALDAILAMSPDRRNQQVIFIQLGRTPQAFFNYAIYNSSFPAIFEGQNTTNTAINMGVPYMQVPAPNMTVQAQLSIYPSVTLGRLNPKVVPLELATVARQINSPNNVWPEKAADAPCLLVGDFYRKYTAEAPTDRIHAYFAALKAHFGRANQDKFCLAAAYLNSLLPVPPQLLLAAGDDENPLNALYTTLEEKVVIGRTLNFVPDILSSDSGTIAKYILDFLANFSNVLSLTVETFKHEGEPPDVRSITLEGPSTVFSKINVDCILRVVLTAPDNKLTADITFANDGAWAMPQTPWIALSKPFIQMRVPNGKLPVAASIGGYYPALESVGPPLVTAKLTISVNNQSQWAAAIEFEDNFPGIATAFQMATSINLVQMLPPPFNILTDLGVSDVNLEYDYANSILDSIAITAQSNTKNLKLFNTLTLSNIKVSTVVLAPTTTRELSVSASADFAIGATDPAIVGVSVSYPGFTIQGELTQGTITIEKLFSTFLPSDYELTLPSTPSIDQFSFAYTKATDFLVVKLKLNIQWTFTFFGKALFLLDDVGFEITREKGANTGFITADTVLLPASAKIGVSVGAYYLGTGNWRFEAKQTSGVVDINALLSEYLGPDWMSLASFPKLDGLSLTMVWENGKASSFEFTAKTAEKWIPIPVLPDISVTGDATIGYKFDSSLVQAGTPVSDQAGAYGTLNANLTVWNIDLVVSFDFNPERKKLCILWLGIKACLTKQAEDTIAVFTLDDKSLGEMVEMFVSWATGASFGLVAPWNLLNDITLNGFSVTYNFSKGTVEFKVDIGPIDFGLFKITAIKLAYDSTKKEGKVNIKVDGTFVWEPNKDSLDWDPTNPATTPAPPGGGNKYLDLRLLALGQHVTVNGLTQQRQVQDVIKMLRDLQVPKPPEIPVGGAGQPVLAPQNSWFVAFDFGVLKAEEEKKTLATSTALALLEDEKPPVYFMQLSIVFNDPTLYALQIALDGPMAKIFAGLNFQIMYRQVSDTVGCYSAQIALPNIMRTFQIGVASITLPVFGIDVYTNGDFQVDIGFPWQMDFTRSFTIQVIVLGVPVLGSAGFYFGKLSSATTDKVPVTELGWFNPVLVFGFGAQIGLGKSIEAGILSAGFSITVFGIIEGVIARWLPYTGLTLPGAPNQLQDGYFFSLTGTFGLQGRLYGTINFVVIKATVDVAISLYIRFTFTAYEDILISASASVRVSVSLEVNLGLFSFSISFSFSANISASFTLANPIGGNPPWQLPKSRALLMHQRRLERASGRPRLFADETPYNPNWGNLTGGTPVQVTGWVAPVLTVAGDTAATPADQSICYVVNFFLPVPAPVQTAPQSGKKLLTRNARTVGADNVAHAALERARRKHDAGLLGTDAGASFEDLAVRVLEWIVAAGLSGNFSPDDVGKQIVSIEFLESALNYLSGASTATPIPVKDIESFLQQQAQLIFTLASGAGQANGVFFPAPPATVLEVPQYPPSGGGPVFQYAFGEYNSSGSDYIERLNKYFNELLVQVQEKSNQAQFSQIASGDPGPSVADFTFSDYFAVVGRQGIQALLDGLKNYKLLLADHGEKTVQELVDWINTTGNKPNENKVLTSAAELFKANENHVLGVNASGPLTIQTMTWQTAGKQSFKAIAEQSIFNQSFDATALATINRADSRILAASVTVTYPGQAPWVTLSGDSLDSLALHFNVTLAELLSKSDVLSNGALISPLAVLAIPDLTYKISSGDTLAGVAGRFAVSMDALATANLGVSSLFDSSSDPNLNVPELSQFQVKALIDEAHRTLALQNLGAMTSRFYLNGLRLPTDGLSANYPGLFVTGTPGNYKYPQDLGLFALTGQAFPLPNISSVDPAFNFSLTRGSNETWLSLGAFGGSTVTFQLNAGDDLARYQSLKSAAQSSRFESGMSALAALDAASEQPGRYPLANRIVWQTPAVIVLPREVVAPSTPQPSLWTLPDPLINLPSSAEVLPRFKPVLARTDAATGNTREAAVENFGFGTLIAFSLRRTAPVAGSAASTRFYELIGATQSDIALLERLLDRLQSDDNRFEQMTLLYPPASTGSNVTGWQSDDQSLSLMGIGQVNLSTETHPPASSLMQEALRANTALGNVINKPTEFLRLLWEASITRSGGFYLSYTTGIGGDTLQGLPDRIFVDGDVAEVAVLSLFKVDPISFATAGPDMGQSVADYMNVLATNEPFDLSDAALIAEAVPVNGTTRALTATDTLAAVAASYYTDISILVSLNPSATLSGSITVAGGRYEVPPGNIAPGGDLDAIAKHFNTTAQAIKDANKYRTLWPNPLPAYTGLILPPITVNIGSGPGGNTSASLSAYYNAPMAAIAAANANVPGFIAAGQKLNVRIGPITLAPLVQAGVAGFSSTRIAPDPLPKPKDPNFKDWGSLYLQHMFNLLGFRVSDNPNFRLSAWGLPASPVSPDGDSIKDKIQALSAPASGDEWIYTRTLPYPSLAKNAPQARAALLPTPAESPYLGVGGLLQFDLAWQDIFGNRILSELTRPQSAADLPASPPSEITGYSDALIGLGQWPGVANAFRVAPDSKSLPTIEVLLAFDESPFVGTDSQLRIEHAITVYRQILFQLGDPNGVRIGLFTSLMPKAESLLSEANAAALVAWVESIYLWLVSLPAGDNSLNPELTLSIPLDITQLNTGQIFRVTAGLTISRNPHLVEGQLSTASGVASTNTTLAPWTGPLTGNSSGLADYNHWRTFQNQIAAVDSVSVQRDLAAFANAFTAAFSSLPDTTLHIATGTDTSSNSLSSLWAVQLGSAQQATAISYAISDVGLPKQFAPRPISNKLVSRAVTPIISYTTGNVIAPSDPSQNHSFTSIDLDQWMQFTLTQIDALLTPRYVAPALILRTLTAGPDALQMLLDAKKALAGALKTVMIPVFKGETASQSESDAIQEAFYQSLLGILTQFYAVKAGIQFTAKVNAAIAKNAGETKPPRLYGDILTLQPFGSAVAGSALPDNISLSSPKLNLAFADGEPVPHFLSLLLSSTTSREASIKLNLGYSCQYIEHEISSLPGIEGYEPSSWLSFADDTTDSKWPLNSELGQFEVPLVLRAFPATPTLVRQDALPTPASACYKARMRGRIPQLKKLLAEDSCSQPGNFNPLATATLWNYGFTYSLAVHSLNDAIHGEIRFNKVVQANLKSATAAPRDLFDNLAEFTTVFPQIQADLDLYLAPLDVGTTDPIKITYAQTALESAATLVQWIADTAEGLGAGRHLRGESVTATGVPYPFSITEYSVSVKTEHGTVDDVLCVTIALPVPPPARIGLPLVEIQPETYTCQPYSSDDKTFSFVYVDDKGDYLLTSISATIADRTLILPDLDVLEYQNAEVSVYLTRNEVLAGRRIADVFVYTTPTVSLPDPLLPTLTDDMAIDLAIIHAVDGKTPVKRSLSCQLTQLYQVLFENSGTDSVTLTLTAYYEYSASSQIPSVRLPVYLMPPTQVAVRAGGTGTPLADVIAEQAQGCEAWFRSMQPSTLEATLLFDLTIMSNLTARPMPILHLSGLYLELTNIDPPLSVSIP